MGKKKRYYFTFYVRFAYSNAEISKVLWLTDNEEYGKQRPYYLSSTTYMQ